MSSPTKKYLDVLKMWFGHSEFRAKQWEAIKAVIEEKRDACIIMATGYGKSLCYQFPPVFCNGLGIIVSPLISLMQDQIMALKVCNISACMFGSAQSDKEKARLEVLNGKYRLMFVTPEWCSTAFGENLLNEFRDRNVNITLVAIDEAHCVSQWGFDFRPKYRKLGKLHHILPNVPVIALTGTATPRVKDDICSSLNLRNPIIIYSSFDRPNLYLSGSSRGKDITKDIESLIYRENTSNNKNGATIIYCPTKKMSEEVARTLNNESMLTCAVYHSDINIKTRQKVHEDFVKNKISVIVATIAFGMGIDKPDVRTVIHYGAPKDIEAYYQEIGRAGRDGLPSRCHVFYKQADFTRNEFFFQNLSGKFLEHKRFLTRALESFLQTNECRRKLLISHFDPNFVVQQSKNCCDNCSKGKKMLPEINVTSEALLMLRAVKAFKGKYGLNMSVALLKGKGQQKRFPKNYEKHELFGIGADYSEDWWKSMGNLLMNKTLLQKVAIPSESRFAHHRCFPMNTVNLTSLGEKFLQCDGSKDVAVIEPTSEMISMRKIKLDRNQFSKSWVALGSNFDNGDILFSREDKIKQEFLLNGLIILREKISKEIQCMPYMVASLTTLQIIAIKRPKTLEELMEIEGFTNFKVNNFGKDFINCINDLESKGILNIELALDSSKTEFKKTEICVDTVDWCTSVGMDQQNLGKCESRNLYDTEEEKPSSTLNDPNIITGNSFFSVMDEKLSHSSIHSQSELTKKENILECVVNLKRKVDFIECEVDQDAPHHNQIQEIGSTKIENKIESNFNLKKSLEKIVQQESLKCKDRKKLKL